MLKAVLATKIIDTKTGKPVKLAKKGTLTRTIQNTRSHLALLKLEANLDIGKHLKANYPVDDWKTFTKRYKVVSRNADEQPKSKANDGHKAKDNAQGQNASQGNNNPRFKKVNKVKKGGWA